MNTHTPEAEEAPYFKHMGDVILNNGFSYIEAEQYIFDQLDDAAENQNWHRYFHLTGDLHQLEDNYL